MSPALLEKLVTDRGYYLRMLSVGNHGSRYEDAFQRTCEAMLRYAPDLSGDAAVRYFTVVNRRLDHDAEHGELFDCHPAREDDHDAFELLSEMRSLPPRHALALLLRWAGFSHREIAEREGWSTRQIERYLTLGRKALA